MTKCVNCQAGIVAGGRRDERGAFCSAVCQEAHGQPLFCNNCISTTSDVTPGDSLTVNTIGVRLFGREDPCPACMSVVQRLSFCVLFLPLVRGPRFRVKYVAPNRFHTRQLTQWNGAALRNASAAAAKTRLESIGLVIIAGVVLFLYGLAFLLGILR